MKTSININEKFDSIKSILQLNEKNVPVVRVDKSLNKYTGLVLFPEKVDKAKHAFKTLGLPDLKKSI
jgi:hypothetical protein